MSWLKSPWFWLVVLVAVVLAWLLFFRGSSKAAGTSKAPQSLGGGSSFFGSLLNSVEAQFSVGDSIMGGGGGSG